MSLELEVKLPLPEPASLRARLAGMGAPPVSAFLENNRFYDLPGDPLRRGDRVLRLRTETPRGVDGLDSPVRHCLTFKGPREGGAGPGLKARHEAEADVQNPDDIAAVLVGLGHRLCVRFEKRRDRHLVAGCRVEIDELPGLGFYVEVEGPDAATIDDVLGRLHLSDAPRESRGYLTLLRASAKATPDAHGVPCFVFETDASASAPPAEEG